MTLFCSLERDLTLSTERDEEKEELKQIISEKEEALKDLEAETEKLVRTSPKACPPVAIRAALESSRRVKCLLHTGLRPKSVSGSGWDPSALFTRDRLVLRGYFTGLVRAGMRANHLCALYFLFPTGKKKYNPQQECGGASGEGKRSPQFGSSRLSWLICFTTESVVEWAGSVGEGSVHTCSEEMYYIQ